jgi:hypothetical protein
VTARSGTSQTTTRATALATLLVGDEARARRALVPAVTHATGALEFGARSVTGLVAAAQKVTRPNRSLSPSEWERDLVRLRYRIWDTGSGPARQDALAAYCACLATARRALGSRSDADRRVQVDAVLRLEQRLLHSRHLSSEEIRTATRAVERSRADIAGRPLS